MKAEKINIGDKFGRWEVVTDLGVRGRHYSVITKCECGTIREQKLYVLKIGRSTSCGCLRKEQQSIRGKQGFTHNLSKHPLYCIWRGIKMRCRLPSSKHYCNYGGRGIEVCHEWYNDFKIFYDWAICNGWQKGLEIDRRNNDGHYEPGNCHFVTPPVSMRNTRRNNVIEFNGVKKCITDWALYLNMSATGLSRRVKSWGIEKALTTPKIIWA